MSKTSNNAIQNAETIIERFGGIRPMASKINVAVTTIQGWKKRGVIPAKRRDEIVQAAENHNIDLMDLLGDTPPANENKTEPPAETVTPSAPVETETTVETITEDTKHTIEEAIQAAIEIDHSAQEQHAKEEQAAKPIPIAKDITKGALSGPKASWITTAIILAGIMAIILLLWPQKNEIKKTEKRLSAIEEKVNAVNSDVKEIKNNGSFFGNLIPADLEQRITNLQEQAGAAQEQVGAALKKAEAISNDVLAENAGTIEQRIEKLEQHATVFASASPELTDMVGRLKTLNNTLGGQTQLDQSVKELNALVNGLGANVGALDSALGSETSAASLNDLLHSSLITGKEQSPVLSETFEGVPPENMKAAAILLGFSQFRSALNRDNKAFDSDLALLSNLIGQDNTELQNAISQLAPHANQGVLSPDGLSKEFRSIAGDLVISSLNGEDVSITEKAQAHFNEILTVEKNGEMISGTTTQQTVSQAQSMLDSGDIAGAISTLQALDGDSAAITAPFLEQAQTTLLAKQVETMLGNSLNLDALGLGYLTDNLDINALTNTLIQQ